ncbi:GNAT family N-acetyltransferase [Simiduia curdlanivorans]|uniref:GNAT family N-acetyltransferase n=1 Tax=Simiduia curdlanivorans TaxID=1492769 RepID=A0ABV8V0U7_9GAMM|nr:GNAT family N-acetyltransferase [Simiduia curdlanivorans]MDN3637650.1 GNAT family N-acetyltransferase [Simiduia curdlanivorans]
MPELAIAASARLSYSLMDADDAELLFELDQDPEVMKYINGGKPNSRETINRVMVPRMQSYRNPEKGWGLWKVCVTETDQFIGWVLVRPKGFFTDEPEWDNLELGWRFLRASWGKGYCTEAALQLANALSEQPSVKVLSALALPDNAGSISVMKKLGMIYVKTDLHRDPLGDQQVVFYQRQLR